MKKSIAKGLCASIVETDSEFPPSVTPPMVTLNERLVGTVTTYSKTTGAGDATFTEFIGGVCVGATFNPAGATNLESGTLHFVVGATGKSLTFVATTLTNTGKSIGDFSLTGTEQ